MADQTPRFGILSRLKRLQEILLMEFILLNKDLVHKLKEVRLKFQSEKTESDYSRKLSNRMTIFKSSNIFLENTLNKLLPSPSYISWLSIPKKYGTKNDVEKDDCEKTPQLQDNVIYCNEKKFEGSLDKLIHSTQKEFEESVSQDKRKETVQRFISSSIATVVFFWIIFDTCTHSSISQLQPSHNEHNPIFKWFFLLEPIYIVVLISAVAVSVVVSAPFSRLHSAMLVFWAILMLIKSAESMTEVYVPILGILFTGCYMLVEKQPELPN